MSDAYLGPEAKARLAIDAQLEASGWVVQSRDEVNVAAGLGVALRDRTGMPDPDYLLFVDGKACGTYEAKKEGWTLTGVEGQSSRYDASIPDGATTWGTPLRFAYEGTGAELQFTDRRDPDPRSRHVFAVHRPETLRRWLRDEASGRETLRSRLRTLPPVDYDALWSHQRDAIVAIEQSLAADRARTLLVMATGSGKTYTAANLAYRLVKHAGAHRVLFLVDRRNLGEQAEAEFKQFVTPDEQRKFEELYGVQRLAGGTMREDAKVVISTIQGVYAALAGVEYDEEDEVSDEGPAPDIGYSLALPPEAFDVIVVDEAHRSIYGRWKPVLEYFDAHLIGLTATPTNRTFGFFEKNLVFEYKHEQAVADGNNVPFEVYRIRTRIGEQGSTVEAGEYATFRDRATRKMQTELLDEDYDYDPADLDRRVVATDQIRTVLSHFRDQLFAPADQGGIFPGRTVVPKTLIFAKDDSHADDIVREVRKVFDKGNDFCSKITSKSTGDKPDELLKRFRNSYNPRIAVTVDLIATGTDVKAIECVFFMRAVKSRAYFEQMKGRGSRVMSDAEFQSVTDDATHRAKTHFVIVDAVGVTDVEHHDTTPLERKKSVTLRKLMDKVGFGNADVDDLSSIMSRLVRIEKELTAAQHQQIADAAPADTELSTIIHGLLTAVDPDLRNAAAERRAREQHGTDEPTDDQIADAVPQIVAQASELLRDNPKLRSAIVEVQSAQMQLIDEVSLDQVVSSGYDGDAGDRARKTVETWKQYIDQHREQIDTFQVVYTQRQEGALTRLRQLAAEVASPPYRLSPEGLWDAYGQLEQSRVTGSPHKVVTDLLALLRFELGLEEELKPFAEVVEWRWQEWLREQDAATRFTPEQIEWLELMKDVITRSLTITRDDFDLDQALTDAGGLGRAWADFDGQLDDVIAELNQQLAP